ncbi:hypothetical protein V2J09_008173 [Rumex salicifolius]
MFVGNLPNSFAASKISLNSLATSILPATMSSSVSSQFAHSSGSYFPTPFHLQQPYTGVIGPTIPVPVPAPVSVPLAPVVPATVSTVPVAPVVPPAFPSASVYPIPQYQQAQQLFQKDAQIITPEALESVKAALANSDIEHKEETKKKAVPRKAAGQTWEDPTLAEWPENDYRLFCGDLGNEVNDDVLSKAFSRFPSFNMARVVRDKRTGKTKGYGFVSFANPYDLAAALKEMNGKYVGNRPIKLRKSNWKERIDYGALEKQKSNNIKKPKLPKKSIEEDYRKEKNLLKFGLFCDQIQALQRSHGEQLRRLHRGHRSASSHRLRFSLAS